MMKLPNVLSKMMFVASILFLHILPLHAQDCICTEVPDVQKESATILTEIGENDYSNFLNVENLKRYSNIQYEGLAVNNFNTAGYTLKSSGRNFELNATYDKHGALINGRIIKKDAYIPRSIQVYLVNSYQEWAMTSNKTVVNDFNALKTEYEVKLQNGNLKKVLFFNHSGIPINKLSRT